MTGPELEAVLGAEGAHDTAVQVLLDHATALVELVKACERLVALRREPGAPIGRLLCELDGYVAAVHEVRHG